jgi:DNA-directed RNA polymerase subunit RPC12/RpoP
MTRRMRMSSENELRCLKCDCDLEGFNTGHMAIIHCPRCGRKLLQKQEDKLWELCTNKEIVDMIRGKLLDMLDDYDDLVADDLAYKAWEGENIDGVVFYSNYEADQFAMRHRLWVDEALAACDLNFGEDGYYAKMKAECNDQFLVVAFIKATSHYLYNQLEIDNDEGRLTKKRKAELRKQFKEVDYDGNF